MGNIILVKKLQNTYYITENMDKSVEFYRDCLGLSVSFRDKNKWTQMKAGEVNFSLSSVEEGASGATGAVVIFEVDDIKSYCLKLKESGAEIIEERDMGDHGKSLTFKDPDGNLVQLFQRVN
ncbi:MAG: glyoxalase [Rhodospirillales bacterium]|nr:glyoxalase [Rhodospirillales bacterium]